MKKIGNVLGSALNDNLIESALKATVNTNLIGSALRDRMTFTEALEVIHEIGTYVDVALTYLQKRKFQYAFETARRHLYGELEIYKAAIDLLIESNRTDLLKRLCQKIYESACEAEPLLNDVLRNCKTFGEIDGAAILWVRYIKYHWEDIISPILQTDADDVASPTLQTKAEAPHRGRPKDVSISWIAKNPDGHLEVLHDLADGKRGVKFFRVIKAAFLKGWFEMPSYKALKKEFGDIGARSSYYDYMGNKYNEKELEQLGATLISRCQNL